MSIKSPHLNYYRIFKGWRGSTNLTVQPWPVQFSSLTCTALQNYSSTCDPLTNDVICKRKAIDELT